MRVFVTGATGWVGSAVVQELITGGHEVRGLVRSDAGAAALAATGAEVHRGSLEDLESLRSGVATVDGVIHTAFNHDFSKFAENAATEGHAIEALGAGLEGSGRPLVITSGVAFMPPGRIATEDDAHVPRPSFPRNPEGPTHALVLRGVRASLIRLPPSVHGQGDHGFVPRLIAIAREQGVSAYIGDGLNRWPAVHRFDAARLYRMVLEHRAAGRRYHAVAEEGVPFKDIAGVIGRCLNVPIVALAPERAAEHFGAFARFAGIDVSASSERTRALIGWAPSGPGLLADLEAGHYFGNPTP